MGWFDKGKQDAEKGQGAKNMQNAPSQAREQYVAGRGQHQRDQDSKKK